MAITTKQPYERYFVYADFSDVMVDGETILNATIVAIDKDLNDKTVSVIEQGTEYADGHRYYFRIIDGLPEESPYKFTLRIETSKGNRWEVDGGISVVER